MAGDRDPPPVATAGALRSVCATRYVAPLREGGSLPGLVEADDDGMYVMKFRGAGQGVAALVAEVVAGELARSLGMLVPELVVAWLEPELARQRLVWLEWRAHRHTQTQTRTRPVGNGKRLEQ
jgi:hypothetical protein